MSDNEQKNTFSEYLGPDFQKKLIWQLLVEPEFAEKTFPNLSIDYFDDANLKRFFIIMLEYWKEFDKVPNLQNKSIEQAIFKYKSPTSTVEEETLTAILESIKLWNERVINKNQLYDGDVIRESTTNFIKQQEFRKLGEHIIQKTKSGEIKKTSFNVDIESRFNKISHIGEDDDFGSDVLDGIDNAMRKEFRETIPTGIHTIDNLTGNGLGKGEIGLMLGASGVGKTTFLTKVANQGFVEGKKVLQIIFEDNVDDIKRKHYAIFSKKKLSEFNKDDDLDELIKQKSREAYAECTERGGKLEIKRFEEEDTSIYMIKTWIERQQKKFGFKYDLIIIDYLDVLEPNRRENDLHAAELSVVKSFLAMAKEYNVPCWSAIQGNRSAFSAEVLEAHNTGGNIKRIQKSHFVMSVAKPDKDNNPNLANVKIVKARFAQDGQVFRDAIFNNDSMEIRLDTGHRQKVDMFKPDAEEGIATLENKSAKIATVMGKTESDEPSIHSKISEKMPVNENEVVSTTVAGLSKSIISSKSVEEEILEINNDDTKQPNEDFLDKELSPEENFNPDELLNDLSLDDEEEDEQKKLLRQKRDKQRVVQRE